MSFPKFSINTLSLTTADFEQLRQELIAQNFTSKNIIFCLALSKSKLPDTLQLDVITQELKKEHFIFLEKKYTTRHEPRSVRIYFEKEISFEGDEFLRTIQFVKEVAEVYGAELSSIEIL